MGKFVKFEGGVAGAVGVVIVVLATIYALNHFAPAKVRTFIAGA